MLIATSRAVLSFVVLASLAGASGAEEQGRPFRLPMTRARTEGKKVETYTVLLRVDKPAALKITLLGGMNYDARKLNAALTDPSGQKVMEKEFDTVKGALSLAIETPELKSPGTHALTVIGEGSFWHLDSRLAVEPGVNLVFPIENAFLTIDDAEWFFMVPQGVSEASLDVGSFNPRGAEFTIVSPDGGEALKATLPPDPKGTRGKFKFPVTPEQAGKPWKLRGARGQVQLKMTGQGAAIAPVFALSPAALPAP